jgi:hypothetical protein
MGNSITRNLHHTLTLIFRARFWRYCCIDCCIDFQDTVAYDLMLRCLWPNCCICQNAYDQTINYQSWTPPTLLPSTRKRMRSPPLVTFQCLTHRMISPPLLILKCLTQRILMPLTRMIIATILKRWPQVFKCLVYLLLVPWLLIKLYKLSDSAIRRGVGEGGEGQQNLDAIN